MENILRFLDVEIIPQNQFNLTSVEETGLTFVENAILKARHACTRSGLPALADDSGIVVDALQGEPGIYSARYAGKQASDEENVDKLLENLKDVASEDRGARFECAMAFMRYPGDPTPIIACGTWQGSIQFDPTGSNGFGYDPIFYVPNHGCSAAELDTPTKNSISHRALALAQLKTFLEQYFTKLDS